MHIQRSGCPFALRAPFHFFLLLWENCWLSSILISYEPFPFRCFQPTVHELYQQFKTLFCSGDLDISSSWNNSIAFFLSCRPQNTSKGRLNVFVSLVLLILCMHVCKKKKTLSISARILPPPLHFFFLHILDFHWCPGSWQCYSNILSLPLLTLSACSCAIYRSSWVLSLHSREACSLHISSLHYL